MTDETKAANRLERRARLRWVPLNKMETPVVSQRDFRQSWAEHIAANMDLEQLGNPVVNERDGIFYVIDGQHRSAAYKIWLGEGWEDQQIQCWCYSGLTEQEEAETFLKLNDRLSVGAMDKFLVGISAGREVETDVDRIVRSHGMTVGYNDGQIRAPGTLIRVYERFGGKDLARTIDLIRDSYGEFGFDAAVLDGLGMLCGRFNGTLDLDVATTKLGNAPGGVNGLITKAEIIRKQTGQPKGQCVAAAAVDIINRGTARNKKLPNWWAVVSE